MDNQGKITTYLGTLLVLVILSASIYIFMPESVRLDFTETYSRFSVWEDEKWVTSATEYMYLYDGSVKMRAKDRVISYDTVGDITTVTRVANYKDNIQTIQRYKFDSTIDDIELFPIDETAECINCVGKIVHFEYRDILYDGETKEITSPFEFGHNMKLTWQDDAYYSKVFQQKVASDKIIIKYKPETNYETYNIRLFDPKLKYNYTTYIYDDFEDASINTTLWSTFVINQTCGGYESYPKCSLDSTLTELGGYSKMYGYSQYHVTSGTACCYGASKLTSILFKPNFTNINKIGLNLTSMHTIDKSTVRGECNGIVNYYLVDSSSVTVLLYKEEINSTACGSAGSNLNVSLFFFYDNLSVPNMVNVTRVIYYNSSYCANNARNVEYSTLVNVTTLKPDGNWEIRVESVGGSYYANAGSNCGCAGTARVYEVDYGYLYTTPYINSQVNYTNDKITYTFGSEVTETGLCTLYGNWSGNWLKNETKSVTANTPFNFTSISFYTSGENMQWNLNCSDLEQTSVFGDNVSFYALDAIAPTITNQINYTNYQIAYIFSAISSDNGQCTLYGNWSGNWLKNETKFVTAGTSFNFTEIAFADNGSSYVWNVECNDSNNNLGFGTNYSFNIRTNFYPTITNLINYTNNQITYIFSAMSSDEGQCFLYGNWTGSWAKNETKSVVTNVPFNFTTIRFPEGNYLWSVNCSANTGFESWSNNNYTFLSVPPYIKLDGVSTDRKYELGTFVNITAIGNCLSIDAPFYGDNYICSDDVITINFSTYPLYLYKFKENELLKSSINISANTPFYLENIDNRSYLECFNLSVIGLGTVSNFSLKYNNILLTQLIGNLTNKLLQIRMFNDETYSKDLTFRKYGSQTMFIALPMQGDIINCTINLSGKDTDKDNAFSYSEDFNDTSYINLTWDLSSRPIGYYDNFWWNKTDWWVKYSNCAGGCSVSDVMQIGNGQLRLISNAPTIASGTNQLTAKVTSNKLFFNNISYLEMPVRFKTERVQTYGPTRYCACSRTISGYIIDGSSKVLFLTASPFDGYTNYNYTFRKLSDVSYAVFINETYSSTIDVSSLNPSSEWQIQFIAYSEANTCTDFLDCCSSSAEVIIDYIKTSGFAPYLEQDWLNFTINGSIGSSILNYTKTPLVSATLSVSMDYVDSGATFVYYMSNDNQTTWEEVTNRVPHTFSSVGKSVSYVINYTLLTNRTYFHIYDVGVDILPGVATDVEIDVGGDGSKQFNQSGIINSSNSPIVVNLTSSDFEIYKATYCEGLEICNVPVIVSANTASIVSFDDLICNINIDHLVLNKSIIEGGNDSIKFDTNFSGNQVNLTDLRIAFLGNKDINVSISSPSGMLSNLVQVKYSDYDLGITPKNINYLSFYPWSPSAKNVAPFGQTSLISILNLTGKNYGDDANFSIYLNNTHSCVNLTISSDSTKTHGLLLPNITWINIGNFTYNGNLSIWMWADYDCSYTSWRYWFPDLRYRSCCKDCVCSGELE